MAAPGPPQSMSHSSSASAPQQPPMPTHSDQITWDGDKMFNIYILDYCKKRGYRKTANELVIEADISPDSKPPINAQQGLLFEWWSVFWVLFQAKNNGAGSEDAMLYHKHQNQLKLRAGQVPPPGVPQSARYPLPNGVPGPPLSASHINGIGPGGQPPSLSGPPPYGSANPGAQPNGIPGPPPAPPGAPGQPFPGGMTGRPPLGPQQRPPNAPQYRSPTIAPSPQGNPPQPPSGAMSQLGRSPHMNNINRSGMLPPNGLQHPQGPGPGPGSAHPTPTLSYQQLGRPPSSHDVSSQNPMNPHRSPALAGRMPPGQDRSHIDNAVDAELSTYPPDLLGEARRQANLGDRDVQSLTTDEKVRRRLPLA
ncbi:hypothetical protein DFH94DRAFT_118906 [Russula ochroleuca]|uniref:LisH domain-containing protein n=1 Tax=Russula ochroleuca TaxID=152965 RepID=A0A9P5MRF5_9AGAM|nr:hypothetical protein DFH94DRAFT_118906 [Russula ochroleuca]